MDELEKKELFNTLYDFYGSLLTPRQREYFEGYYFLDLSLSEMAASYQVSRSAIFDQLKNTLAALKNYEDSLGLARKELKLEHILEEYENSECQEVRELVNKIKNME